MSEGESRSAVPMNEVDSTEIEPLDWVQGPLWAQTYFTTTQILSWLYDRAGMQFRVRITDGGTWFTVMGCGMPVHDLPGDRYA